MPMFSHFSGRIVQVIEGLDLHDAVSNHVLSLDRTLREDYGLRTEIFAGGSHPEREQYVRHIALLELDERDIVIYHYSGYAEHTAEKVASQKAIKILHYHNITPHEFFRPGSHLYQHCREGRRQLVDLLDRFDLFTGDSQYNIDELISLGISKDKTQVLRIVLDTTMAERQVSQPAPRNVLFVGRIAENKRQDRIVEVYSRLLKAGHQLGKLVLVGRYDSGSPFYKRLMETVRTLDLQDRVEVMGRIGQSELNEQYANAGLFLSMSEHEGFGVPLLEACRHDIPVLALARTAVPETLQHSPGLFETDAELVQLVARIEKDPSFREALLAHQRAVLASYNNEVHNQLARLLNRLIPQPDTYTSVSIVICTYNRGDLLDRALDYLQRQHDPRCEVVVVDGPSTDNTGEVIDKWRHRIKVAKNSERNLSISRNIGIRLAAGDIVAFIDDDALPFGDWVGALLAEYNSVPRAVGGIGGVTYLAGSLEFQAEDIVVDSYGRATLNPTRDETLRSDRFRTQLGTNSSFKRKVLLEIGGFDEEYDYFLDESDVCMRVLRAGYRLVCSPQLFIRHEFAQSDNRINKYRYNWYSICKNTAYFALRFNTGNPTDIISAVREQIAQDRVAKLTEGLKRGVVAQDDFDAMGRDIWRGVEDGIRHAAGPRHLLHDADSPSAFLHYHTEARVFTPLHVMLVTKEFPPFTPSGGVGTLFYHLASELLLMGHRVSVIAQGPEESRHQRGRFTLHRIPAVSTSTFGSDSAVVEGSLNWSMRVAEMLLEIHRRDPISVIDTCVWDYEMYAFAAYRPRVDIPLVVRLVTPFAVACESNGWKFTEREKDLVCELERGLIDMADCVIPISDSIKETFTKVYGLNPDKRWHTVPAGLAYWPSFEVDKDYAEIAHLPELAVAKESGKFIFLFLGRLEPRKGIDVFLSAVQHFVERHPMRDDCLFVVAGKDCMRLSERLHEYLDRAARARVLFTGELSLGDRDKVYSAADVVVFPSRYESFGLVPLEAFVHGKPVIGANAGAIPEVVQHDRSGLLFEDGDPGALADCLERLLDDRALCRRLGQGARHRIRELSSAKMALRSEEVYRLARERTFYRQYHNVTINEITKDSSPISIDEKSLSWLDVPRKDFIDYVIHRDPLPFDEVPPDDNQYIKKPTFMITQMHRLWLTARIIDSHLEKRENGVFLDVGAFPFSMAIILREYLKYKGRITATINLPLRESWKSELDRRAIHVLYANLDPYVRATDEDENVEEMVNGIELESESVDFINCSHVIEHLYHPLEMLKEMYRVLKVGGKLLVSSDNALMLNTLLHLWSLSDFLHEPVEGTAAMSFGFWRGHNRFFTEKDTGTMLKKVGFRIIENHFYEVLYNSFCEDYFRHPIVTIPRWRADILTRIPEHRNELIVVAAK
ncbi:MAG: glycosyltransferase [Nitrospirota bacterium]